jgi:MFS family permease
LGARFQVEVVTLEAGTEAKSRLFFGWWIVVAAFVTALYVGGVVFYGFTAVFEPIVDEFGWSYTKVSLGASLRGLEMGLLAPLVGVLFDRVGPGRLVAAGSIILASGLFMLARTTSLLTYYGAFVLIAIGAGCCASTVLVASVGEWFRRRVGIATGIALCGFGFGGLMVPLSVRLIGALGWRDAMVSLAVGMLAVVLPLSLVFGHRPDRYGLPPDGEMVSSALARKSGRALEEPASRLREALRTRELWTISVAFICHSLVMNATITHVMPCLSTFGVPRWSAGVIAAMLPGASILGRLGFGWLADRLRTKSVAAGSFGLMAVGVLCFAAGAQDTIWLLYAFAVLLGIGYGGNVVLRAALTREHFGHRHFGSVFGFILGISMLGGIAGPVLAGWVFDSVGSYRLVWLLCGGLSIGAAMSILTISTPEPHARRE